MPETFLARPAVEEAMERASLTDLDNPFLTARYLHSQRMLGREGWLLSLEEAGAMRAAALCFLDREHLRRILTIPSAPSVAADSPLWSGMRTFIAEHGITDLELSTFASPESRIPHWPGELQRIDRTEFAMPLKDVELLPRVSKSHRERISKARRKGLVVRREASDAAIDAHVALHINSMDRRRSRGENVSLEFERAGSAALLASGAGELFQALLGDHVASSLLILRSSTGAYSESSGNSKEGMAIGASHFLRFESASALQAEGVEIFYLGGVRPDEEGLRSFKSGFGTTPIDTQSVSAYVGGPMRRHLSSAIQWLRSTAAPRQ
jgi:GNAT acetyltransferase-like protein